MSHGNSSIQKTEKAQKTRLPNHIYIPNPRGHQVNMGLCFQEQQLWNLCLSGTDPQVTCTSLKSCNYLKSCKMGRRQTGKTVVLVCSLAVSQGFL